MIRKTVLVLTVIALAGLSCIAIPSTADAAIQSSIVMPSPNGGTVANELRAVSCLSTSWCFAVGTADNGSGPRTLTEMWNGASWSVVSSPNPSPGTTFARFNSVSCVSTNWCVAVGYYTEVSNGPRTLTEMWNGASWSVVAGPVPGSLNDELRSVSCVSTSFCIAVGTTQIGGPTDSLIEMWDGATWSIMSHSNPAFMGDDELRSVSCVSTSFCTAVGFSWFGAGNQTLVEKWDGSSWSIPPSPNASVVDDKLMGVSCISASWCVAVGQTFNGNTALVEHWDGTSWTITAAPNPGIAALLSVSCTSPSSCVADGFVAVSFLVYKELVMAWDGNTWVIVPNPTAAGLGPSLNSTSCVSVSWCVAVGSVYGPSGTETLVESLTGPEPEPPTTTTSAASDPVAPAFTG